MPALQPAGDADQAQRLGVPDLRLDDEDEGLTNAAPPPSPAPRPVPVAPVAPAEAAGGIRDLICAYDWPCAEALLVVYGPTPPNAKAPRGCLNGESGGQADAVGAGSIGLFQIQVSYHVDKVSRVVGRTVGQAEATQLLLNPEVNAAVGWLVYAAAGYTWLPWSCRP